MDFHRARPNPVNAAAIAIIAVGVLLRLHGMNWDQGLYLHPDERFIAIVSSERVDAPSLDNLSAALDPANSPLNPRRDGPDGRPLSFAYGTLPVYVQSVASWAVNLVADSDYQRYPNLYKVGRPLTVLMDALTMALIFLLARRLFGPAAGLIATTLYAFSVLSIQLSHFFTVDVWLTTFVTATLYLAVRYADKPTLGRALAMGVPVGCAFATKASVPSLLVPLGIASGWVLWRSADRVARLAQLAAAGALALAVFTVFEPYAIVRSGPFFEDIGLQSRIVRGRYDVPFTRQFVGLTPGVYELKNLFRYSLGPAFTIAALAGVAFAARHSIRRRDIGLVLTLAWVVAYVPIILITEAKFLRYVHPLTPALAICAAGLLVVGLQRRRVLAPLATAILLIVTAVWAAGFSTIYDREHPRIAASHWMHANIPAGSAVSIESWDDALPLPYSGAPPMRYQQVTFDMYGDQPPEEKVVTLAESLQSVDYVILSSNRVIDSVDNLPWRYAVQNEFYRRLVSGQLGFQLVYEAQLRPTLFGYRYDDSGSDESFSVYDHPHVRIFQKVEELTTEQVRERLLWGIEQPWIPQRYAPEPTLRLSEPVGEIDTSDDAEWNPVARSSAALAIVSWLLAIEVIGLAALPLAAALLPRTPDRGAFSARLLGLLIVTWIGWFAGSVGLWRSTALRHVLVIAAVGALAWAWRMRSARRQPLPTRRMLAAGAAVWGAVIGLFLLLRAAYPDFWQTWFGGEKPFELAYLRAVAQSMSFPPYDPWFADGTINYYYYGWQMVATITRVSGVGVDLGFQLALASFAGLVALQTASLGGLLMRRGRGRLPLAPVAACGALVAFAMLFAGNLDAVSQVVAGRALFSDTFDFWRSTRVIQYTINEFPYFSFLWADVHPHVLNFPVITLLLTLLTHLALAGRLTLDGRLVGTGAAVALALGTVGVTNSWDAPLAVALTLAAFTYAGALRGVRGAVVGASAGLIPVVVSFALFAPFYLGFYSVVEGVKRTTERSDLGEFLVMWGIFFLVLLAAMASDALTRVRDSVAVRDGLAMAVLTLLAGFVSQFALGSPTDGPPYRDVVIALLLSALVVALAAAATTPSRFPLPAMVSAAVLAAVVGAPVASRPAASVALAVAYGAALYVWTYRRAPSRLVPWAFASGAALIIASVEFVYIADDLQRSPWERMNTVFKFYLQAWTLLAVATGVILARLLVSARWWHVFARNDSAVLGITTASTPRPATRRATQPVRSMLAPRAASVAGVVVLALGVLYPLAGTPVRLNQDMPTSPSGLTLDGYAWMDGGFIHNHTGDVIEFSGDLGAIDWLRDNVDGTPVILEASIGPYRGNGGRISSATGLPAVLGWDRHQRQQRQGPGISKRMADVREIYNLTDPERKMEMLRRYRVEYVIVGDVERKWNNADDTSPYASSEGLATFDTLLGNGLTLVFESGSTRVYQVDDFPRLAPAPGARHEL